MLRSARPATATRTSLLLAVLLAAPAWATSLLGAGDGTHGLRLLAQAPLPGQPAGDPRAPLRAELEQLRDVPSLVPGIVMEAVGYPVGISGAWMFFSLVASMSGNPVALLYAVALGAVALAGVAVAIVGTVLVIRAIVVRTTRATRTGEVEEELERLDRQLPPERPVPPGPPREISPEPYPPGVWLPAPVPALVVAVF